MYLTRKLSSYKKTGDINQKKEKNKNCVFIFEN